MFGAPRLLAGIVGVSVVSVAVLILGRAYLLGYFDDEIWKLVTQFFLVTVVGGSIALIFRHYEYRRDQRQANVKLLMEFHARLMAAYHAAKLARRQLRAHMFEVEKSYFCDRQSYEKLMDDLERAQLQAEALMREVVARPELFGASSALADNLKRMESYLRDLLKDYEDCYGDWRAGNPASGNVPVDGLLLVFSGKAGNKSSEVSLFGDMDLVCYTLLALIGACNAPEWSWRSPRSENLATDSRIGVDVRLG